MTLATVPWGRVSQLARILRRRKGVTLAGEQDFGWVNGSLTHMTLTMFCLVMVRSKWQWCAMVGTMSSSPGEQKNAWWVDRWMSDWLERLRGRLRVHNQNNLH